MLPSELLDLSERGVFGAVAGQGSAAGYGQPGRERKNIGWPVMAAAPERRKGPRFVSLDEKQFDQEAVEHKRTFVRQSLGGHFHESPVALGEAVDNDEIFSRVQQVDVLMRTDGAQPAQLFGPPAEDPTIRTGARQQDERAV